MNTFDAFAPRDDEEELSDESGSMSDEDESESEERGESEEELRKYNLMQQQQQQVKCQVLEDLYFSDFFLKTLPIYLTYIW